jgi:cysteine desulfurase/selenocysteine lyase
MTTATGISQHGSAAGEAPLDVERVRRDFPVLRQMLNRRPLVYLDNAATTQRPTPVVKALNEYYRKYNANIHRGVHRLSVRATDAYEGARGTVARFLNAARAEEIVFVRGATEAINLVAQSFGRTRVGAGDEILISHMEHHANIVPWQMLCQQTGATLRVVPIDERGELRLGDFEKLIGERTKLLAVTHASNALGTVNPVRELIRVARERGVPVLLDGAQAVPHLHVDVRALDCDFYAFSGHKIFGPTGIGVLYGKHDLLEGMPPYQGGGDMIRSVSFEGTTYADPPQRFEAGTPHVAGAIGLAAALDYLKELGLERIAAYERRLLAYGTDVLQGIPGVRLIGTAAEKVPVLSFVIEGVHPHDAGTVLDQLGVAIRSGHHCAQPVMDRFGVPATARASLAFYNTHEELDVLADGIRKAIEVLS